jgi:phosphoenolpyruvate synthase/pyruvate phosphate dikinase
MRKFVKSFKEMGNKDFQEAGGKAANLGELTQAGFNVPPGFCVTSDSLFHLIDHNDLRAKIKAIVAQFDYEDYGRIETQTGEIRELIRGAEIPEDLYLEIKEAIFELDPQGDTFVAVRSSVAVKDSSVSSFPGMMDTYHYIKGEDEILKHIKMCWASLWTSRATLTRHHKKIDHEHGLIAPIVQKMVNADVAGVLFTANPITSTREEMVIEANWGLGESVVSGKSMNDFFLLSKSPLTVKNKRVSKKTLMVCYDTEKGCGRKEMSVDPRMMDAPTLSDEMALALGEIGLKIEAVFGFPQDIEWAYQQGELFILQSRNIRTLKA